MKMLFKKNGRDWLNPVDSYHTGLIQHSVESSVYKDDELLANCVDANFDIWDCSRKVSLDFSYSSNESYQQSLDKVNLLINHLREFKDSLMMARNTCDFSKKEDE